MKRKTELYKVIIESKNINKEGFFDLLEKEILLKDFLEYYYKNNVYNNINISDVKEVKSNQNEEDDISKNGTSNSKGNSKDIDKKIDVKSKHICYYLKNIDEVCIGGNETNKEKLRKVLIEYVKYDKKLKIVDKDTLEQKFEKSKNQGDLEKQHYLLETYNDTNKALIVWEKVLGAITISLIEKDFNSKYRNWIKDKYKDDDEQRKEFLEYNIKIYAIPSKDFIEELLGLDRISLLKVSVAKEKFSADEDILFSEENISRDDVEIVYKPVSGLSFSKTKVKQYVEKFKKGKKIKRIVINGTKNNSSITLNTELIKMNETLDIKEGVDGLVDSSDLFKKFQELINDKYNYLSEIFIDVKVEEE